MISFSGNHLFFKDTSPVPHFLLALYSGETKNWSVRRNDMKYKIHKALWENIEFGSIWIGNQSGQQFPPRTVVKVTNKRNEREIFCELQTIEAHFGKKYKEKFGIDLVEPEKVAFISGWYRSLLNVAVDEEVELEVKKADRLYGRIRSSLDHPEVIVRVSVYLAIWSIILGVIAILIAVSK
jgi:hypothetical protein